MILLNLDHFKLVNDTYGHLAGDAVLRETARHIVDRVRPYDTAGRRGGEEFLMLVPSCDESGLMGVAERLRAAVGSTPINTETGPIQITIRCGVCRGGGDEPLDSHELIQRADEALDRAKCYGPKRTELAIATDRPPSSFAARACAPQILALENPARRASLQ